MLLLLLALWTLWGACWLRRVELQREKDPVVRALGLSWAREGFGPTVRAVGTVAGRAVEVLWRRGMLRDRTRVRDAGEWRDVTEGADLLGLLGDTE